MRYVLCLLAACGGGDTEVKGDPLAASTLMAQYDNRPFTPAYGFARMENANFVLRVSDKKISCADDFDTIDRDGLYASTGFSGAPMVGTASTAYTISEVVDGGLLSKGATGSTMITAVTETQISAVFAFAITENGKQYSITGAVTMLRCP